MVQSATSVDLYILVFGGALALSTAGSGHRWVSDCLPKTACDQALIVKEMELSYQQDVIYRTLDAVEDERKRVARDLHDEVGAALSAMRLLIGQLSQTNLPAAEANSLTTTFKGVIDHTIDSVRRISNDLLPQGLDELGLAYALEGLCETTMNLADVTVDLVMDDEIMLSGRTNLIVYRLVQELLNNALKHAEATTIDLNIRQTADALVLHYADNGKGFDYEQAWQKRSFGLKNIETRAHMLNGAAVFETQPGQGLRVTIQIPLNN